MRPVLQALVLAERVYEEKSGKKIIAGTFNGLLIGRSRPKEIEKPDGSKTHLIAGGTDFGCPSLYLSLTDVVNGTEIAIQMCDVARNQIVFTTSIPLPARHRLDTVEIIAQLPKLTMFIKKAGVFSFDLVWQGEILGSHRLVVKEMAPEDQHGEVQ